MIIAVKVDHHVCLRSLSGRLDECGDVSLVIEDEARCFLALVDALGHGQEAHAIAQRAREYLDGNHHLPLVELMKGLHLHLKSTRGAVAALCRLDKNSGELDYTGMGNISVKILGKENRSLVPRDGIIGYMMSSPVQHRTTLSPGDILLMSTDGVKEHFSIHDHPQLLKGSARQIVQRVLETLAKGNDDACCVVLRYAV